MQISRNPFILLVGAFASALILSACGGGEEGAQATLTVVPEQSSLSAGASTSLTTSGGSGDGAVTFAVASGSCTIDGPKLTAASSAGTCLVTATKAADTTYAATTSAAVTITVTAASTTFLNFDDPTELGGIFGGVVASSAEDPSNANNQVVKLVKGDGAAVWAGATLAKCTYPAYSLPVIPFAADKLTMTLKVYSATTQKIQLTVEDASSGGAHQMSADADLTVTNAWTTLTFDFTDKDKWNKDYVYNKASVRPNNGATTASTLYIDDLKFVGSSDVSQSCMTPPPTPSEAATVPTASDGDVLALYSNKFSNPAATGAFPTGWSSAAGSELALGSNTVRKLAGMGVAGLEPNAVIDGTAYTTLNISVWTSTGTSFYVKLVDYPTGVWTDGGLIEQELTLAAPTQNAWTYYQIPLSDFSAMSAKNKIGQIILRGSGADYYIDDIYFSK